MKSNNKIVYSKEVIKLLNYNKVKLNKLFKDIQAFKVIQKTLLLAAENKDEVNYIIKLSKGLYNNLTFIKENFSNICKILEEKSSIFSKKIT